MIKELVDDHGRRLLVGARMVPSPLPVEERPEWDLRNADGLYTLQIAAFFTAPEVPNLNMAAGQSLGLSATLQWQHEMILERRRDTKCRNVIG